LNVHPVADIFPRMGDAEFQALKADIAKHGQREPVWTWRDQIIDGRHRVRACDELGHLCLRREYEGDESTLVQFVVSLNLHRRHLDESQRAMVSGRIARLPVGANQHASIEAPSQKQAAELLNVSRASVQRAREVIDNGAPELVQAVERGEVSVSLAAAFVALDDDEIKNEALSTLANAPESAREAIREAVKKAHVANNSGNNEWYTPARYIALARQVMGGIDTDPASSEVANRTVQAARIFTQDDDGRTQTWTGRVWMNPPYAQPLIADFAEAVASKYESGEIEQACVLVNNGTETQWFQRMLSAASAVCFPKSRIKFIDPEGNPSGAPLQGQAVIYLGGNPQAFLEAFKAEGEVLIHG